MKKIFTNIADNPYSTAAFILGLFFLISSFFTIHTYAVRRSIRTCASFNIWQDAQNFYLEDPVKHGYLDKNHNGEACELLKKK